MNKIMNKIIKSLVSWFYKTGLYCTSLFWLFLLLILFEIDPNDLLSLYDGIKDKTITFTQITSWAMNNILIIFSLLGLLYFLIFNYYFNKKTTFTSTSTSQIAEIENVEPEQLVFLATYILPILSYNSDSLRPSINIIIIILVEGFIFCRTNLFYANPTLSTLNYKVFKIKETANDSHYFIISKTKLNKNDTIFTNEINETTYFAVNSK